jgi:hypothetical protein
MHKLNSLNYDRIKKNKIGKERKVERDFVVE